MTETLSLLAGIVIGVIAAARFGLYDRGQAAWRRLRDWTRFRK